MQTGLHDELNEFQADHQWIERNRGRLLDQFPDQWIAVRSRQVIANDVDLDRLLSKLSDPAHTPVEYLGHEPLQMIL